MTEMFYGCMSLKKIYVSDSWNIEKVNRGLDMFKNCYDLEGPYDWKYNDDDLSVVKYFSDRIGVMYFGKMVELTTSDELFAHPLHPYTKSLLSAIPLPDPEYEKNRKRITYNPIVDHNYSVDKPSMREVSPGHFVFCNDAEEAKYKELLKK